jgi:hypothetical protein
MIEIKRGQDNWVPVRMLDSGGAPITGIVFGSVSVSVRSADAGALVTYAPTTGQWAPVDTGAFAGTGVYNLVIPSSVAYAEGSVTYAVGVSGARTYIGAVKGVTYIESDTYVRMRELQEGRWKIWTSGADANRLVLYAGDGVTAIQKWDLKDSSGTATAGVNVFERVPVLTVP